VIAAVLMLGAVAALPARAAGVLDPTSVDTNTDTAFHLSPGDTSTMTDVTITVPAGFRVFGCPSSANFTCHQSGMDASQDTTVQWLRNAGTEGHPQPDDRFEFDAHSPNAPGNYTFTVATNDSVNGAQTFEPTVQVKGNAVTTTSTTARTTTTSTSSTTSSTTTPTSLVEPGSTSTTSTTVARVARSASRDSGHGDDTNNVGPLAAGAVLLGVATTGTALRIRRIRGGKLPV
jgi:hypothetical protein